VGIWRRLRSWWRRPSLGRVEVVLYTRQGCHLCEDALRPLEAARGRYGFRLVIRDVDTDSGWKESHGEWVPVVAVDGKVRFRGRVNEVLLERLLRGMARGGT
jgi:glutaredoxin